MKLIDLRAIIGARKPSGKISFLGHEIFIVLAFCAFTTLLTYPYINHLRNAVADTGDPYLESWVLWWDFHQTFTNPLHLFDANIFYPYRYTLAFSEHCYGIALLFFPLFALGLRPLTVHAVAMFFGFALCGYSAFRLARTLTGSEAIGWITGIIFAFVPFRFHLLSHVLYLFSPWIALLFEALVLFVRKRSRQRAVWLGCAFFMLGLSTISWFILSLVPFAVIAAVLLTRHGIWAEREFWRRAAVALGIASIALLPFMVPYLMVSKMYGFKRSIEEVKANSAWPIHWFSVENRNKLWNGMGANLPEGYKFKLFPGLLPILLSLVAVIPRGPFETPGRRQQNHFEGERWLKRVDASIWFAFAISIAAIGLDGTDRFLGLFRYVTSERALAILTVAIIARLALAYPSFIRASCANLVETIRSGKRGDAFWLGVILTIIGFCYSLGWNFFFYRICYDLLPMFRSMRVPPRGAMMAYLGLAILAGLGVQRVAQLVVERRPGWSRTAVFVIAGAALLFEFNGAPLGIVLGEVYPDAVTLRLKATPMRGGVVILPASADFNHRYILRAADHERPLIVGTSGFNSPLEDQIEAATRSGFIPEDFMDLLEGIPTSYVVVATQQIAPERRLDYEAFLAHNIKAGRLRFINRFDSRDDLFAVVKTEPQAKSEAALPFAADAKAWAGMLKEDPMNLLGQFRSWSQAVYRFQLATYGSLPRYQEFVPEVESIGQNVFIGLDDQQSKLEGNLRTFAEAWVARPEFQSAYKAMSNEQYVEALIKNAGIDFDPTERAGLVDKLDRGDHNRAELLLDIVNKQSFVEKEQTRSLVLLHYFAYLHRNPDDPPDNNLKGFNYWIQQVEKSGDSSKLAQAFMSSFEYEDVHTQPASEKK
jgi:hypothetical protein